MGATVYQERNQEAQQAEQVAEEQTQPKLTFKDWVLQFTKKHKKRTSTDVTMGTVITAGIFLISLV